MVDKYDCPGGGGAKNRRLPEGISGFRTPGSDPALALDL